MLAFADVMDLFTDELARLCRRRLSGTFVRPGALQSCLFRHNDLLSAEKATGVPRSQDEVVVSLSSSVHLMGLRPPVTDLHLESG
jgi:hypothetical protein